MFDFVCTKCGKIQEPKEQGKNFNTFDVLCTECGGKLDVKMRTTKKEVKHVKGGRNQSRYQGIS